jgi:hypothetical protein
MPNNSRVSRVSRVSTMWNIKPQPGHTRPPFPTLLSLVLTNRDKHIKPVDKTTYPLILENLENARENKCQACLINAYKLSGKTLTIAAATKIINDEFNPIYHPLNRFEELKAAANKGSSAAKNLLSRYNQSKRGLHPKEINKSRAEEKKMLNEYKKQLAHAPNSTTLTQLNHAEQQYELMRERSINGSGTRRKTPPRETRRRKPPRNTPKKTISPKNQISRNKPK